MPNPEDRTPQVSIPRLLAHPSDPSSTQVPEPPAPWWRRVRRWGQTNLTECDPLDYDAAFWREQWRRTRVQGVIVNAGGIVAYYPTEFPLQYRAEKLGERDLFGEIVRAAREEGLAVLARMDSNRAEERFWREKPDWFSVNAQGEPCIAGGRYQACVNSPYYQKYLPDVLREIVRRYRPDGFTDNSWGGLRRQYICHCPHCKRKFKREVGLDLPPAPDWNDRVYRHWIAWSYRCRLENWDRNNLVTHEAGGQDCVWIGMVNGDPVGTHAAFCDLREVAHRSVVFMNDQQGRPGHSGFESNSQAGKLLHELLGWDKNVPESFAMYVRGERTFRRAANPPAEARAWMMTGFAGGISPWWHHVGARQDDRRQFATAEPLMRWHEVNEDALYDREPVAAVGIVWSQINTDFHGRDDAGERVGLPWQGWVHALTRARIPFLPVHADDIERQIGRLGALVLPDLAAMTDAQCDAVRRFVAAGGSLVATGRASLSDEWGQPRLTDEPSQPSASDAAGQPRPDFALGDLFGVTSLGGQLGVEGRHTSDWEQHAAHNYLRFENEPGGARHAILAGFEETDIVGLGGTLLEVAKRSAVGSAKIADVLASYVPAFPIYPPEFSWMREPRTDHPAILAREMSAEDSGPRIVYFAADLDRAYGRTFLPDQGDLLAAAARWVLRDRVPLRIEGPGYFDCHLYRQASPARWIVHLVNLTGCNIAPGYLEEHLPVGPLTIRVRLGEGRTAPHSATPRVAGGTLPVTVADGWASVTLERIVDHELIVFAEDDIVIAKEDVPSGESR